MAVNFEVNSRKNLEKLRPRPQQPAEAAATLAVGIRFRFGASPDTSVITDQVIMSIMSSVLHGGGKYEG